MNIQTFADLTGLSRDTLRYYEKIGLLNPVLRNASGHRVFTQADIAWVEFIQRLKATAMPLKDIQTYTALRKQGDGTSSQRMQILQNHAVLLEEKINADLAQLNKLREKIAYYESQLPPK